MIESNQTAWIQTYLGHKFFPLAPDASQIFIRDVAQSLAMQCRFNGHTSEFYSVAEHCCHVHDQLPPHLQLAGLLHDASEAYLCDLPRPLKQHEQFAETYREAEARLERVIAKRFCFTYPLDPLIKQADEQLLHTEALRLMVPLHPEWQIGEPVPNLVLPLWDWRTAKKEFLARFYAAVTPQGW